MMTEPGLMDWPAFLENAKAFFELSQKVGDNWELREKDKNECNTYLVATRKFRLKCTPEEGGSQDDEPEEEGLPNEDFLAIQSEDELFEMEYHVVYSISYQVPLLYFKGYRRDGKVIDLDTAWKIFESASKSFGMTLKKDMLKILTQLEHPVLFMPFFALHPCKTHAVLSNTPKSKNLILTFLSLFGPYVGLDLSNSYGTLSEK